MKNSEVIGESDKSSRRNGEKAEVNKVEGIISLSESRFAELSVPKQNFNYSKLIENAGNDQMTLFCNQQSFR